MDALTHVETYSWHTIRKIKNLTEHLYVGHVWEIEKEIFLIGATIGLLCFTTNRAELYLSISKDPDYKGGYFTGLKKNFLFYAQRDQRAPPVGQNDLIKEVWLPAGSGFYCKPGEKLYFKCGAMNKSGRDIIYDIFATIYYVKVMSSPYEPIPTVEPEPELNKEDEYTITDSFRSRI